MRDGAIGNTTTAINVPGGGVTGSGEELALTLEKVVSQLDIISRTLHVLEQRVSMNEESVSNCLQFFKEAKEARNSGADQARQELEARIMSDQLLKQQQMRYDLDQLKDLTSGVQDGLANQISNAQMMQERDFMLSRQTLGRPPMGGVVAGDTLGAAADNVVGSTIVTQFNRDNLDDDAAVGNDEIDDLRRA